jgi:hypothetical protein
MTFKDIIIQSNFRDVKKSLLQFYPSQTCNINKYANIYRQLIQKEPKRLDIHWMIMIEYTCSILDEKNKCWQIYSVMLDDPFKEHFDIKYIPWDQWLSYDMNIKQIKNIGMTNIIAHCLYEMTYYGWDEARIQAKHHANDELQVEEEFDDECAQNITDVIINKIDKNHIFNELL